MNEKPAFSLPGGLIFLLIFAAVLVTGYFFFTFTQMQVAGGVILCVICFPFEMLLFRGLMIVNPDRKSTRLNSSHRR